jgi:hypothetical protein
MKSDIPEKTEAECTCLEVFGEDPNCRVHLKCPNCDGEMSLTCPICDGYGYTLNEVAKQ